MKKILWDTLMRSRKALPRAWDQLTPETRRACFVGNSFLSFKLWKNLTPKEQATIKHKLHYKKDVERICKMLKKFMQKENKMSDTKKSKNSSSKTTKKSTSHSSKTKKHSTKKVVPIVDALKVDCTVKDCHAKKGHRCVNTHNKIGQKRDNPHRVRIQLALKKLAAAKKDKKAA